jgi:hypothetical protein
MAQNLFEHLFWREQVGLNVEMGVLTGMAQAVNLLLVFLLVPVHLATLL